MFAGVGGLSLGLDRAGWECAGHAEIDPFARRVLEKRWPNVPLYGDVTGMDGGHLVREVGHFDLLSGGSPCQDLSQAGARAGLAGARSGLFYHQMRLWRETGAEMCLWENVHGAFSSSKGRDFAAVLSAFVGDVVDLPPAKSGSVKWSNAGVVCGPDGVAAWRVFDAKFWGVAQRRRRVFVLGSRTGVVDPAEILFEREGVSWHPTPCLSAREAAAVGAGLRAEAGVRPNDAGPDSAGPAEGGVVAVDFRHGTLDTVVPTMTGGARPKGGVSINQTPGVIAFQERGREGGRNLEMQEDIAYAVTTKSGGGRSQEGNIVAFYANSNGEDLPNADATCPPIKVGSNDKGTGGPAVIAFEVKQDGASSDDIAPTLRAMPHDTSHANGGGQVGVVQYAVCEGQRAEVRLTDEVNTLAVRGGKPGQGYPAVLGTSRELRDDEKHWGEPNEPPVARMLGFGHYEVDGTASAIKSRDYKDATDIVLVGRPRRLIPRECEALMGWPKGWTEVPDPGPRGKPASDALRYKAIGNGVVANIPQWVGERLGAAVLALDDLRRRQLNDWIRAEFPDESDDIQL